MSRFDLSIRFELPDLESRKRVFERYARQFSIDGDRGEREVVSPPLQVLAAASDGLSCRDIKVRVGLIFNIRIRTFLRSLVKKERCKKYNI
jgi:AAA+ superfamily predicted ATPase